MTGMAFSRWLWCWLKRRRESCQCTLQTEAVCLHRPLFAHRKSLKSYNFRHLAAEAPDKGGSVLAAGSHQRSLEGLTMPVTERRTPWKSCMCALEVKVLPQWLQQVEGLVTWCLFEVSMTLWQLNLQVARLKFDAVYRMTHATHASDPSNLQQQRSEELVSCRAQNYNSPEPRFCTQACLMDCKRRPSVQNSCKSGSWQLSLASVGVDRRFGRRETGGAPAAKESTVGTSFCICESKLQTCEESRSFTKLQRY